MLKISRDQNDPHRYDDIIGLPHPEPRTHPRMSSLDRAAQFAPFAALTGHEEAVRQTAEEAEERIRAEEAGIPWEEGP